MRTHNTQAWAQSFLQHLGAIDETMLLLDDNSQNKSRARGGKNKNDSLETAAKDADMLIMPQTIPPLLDAKEVHNAFLKAERRLLIYGVRAFFEKISAE